MKNEKKNYLCWPGALVRISVGNSLRFHYQFDDLMQKFNVCAKNNFEQVFLINGIDIN